MQLIHGDCLEKMKDIPDKSIGLVLTDPPYACTSCKWDIALDMSKVWTELERILSEGCAVVLNGNEPFSSFIRVGNALNYKYDWIWARRTFQFPLAKKHPSIEKHHGIQSRISY